MEKLNEYLQQLMSTCSYELHLEPNKNPYIVSANGSSDVANAPLLGTQISTLIFPIIPNASKMELPNKNEIEFTHAHNLGNFSFQVCKSPEGFNVTIRPIISDPRPPEAAKTQNEKVTPPPAASFSNEIEMKNEIVSPTAETETFAIESSSIVYENETQIAAPDYKVPEIEIEDVSAYVQNDEIPSLPPVETVPVNDPEFVTTFSDDSTYEPPARRGDLEPAAPQQEAIEPVVSPEPEIATPPVQPVFQPPVESEFIPARANARAQERMDALFRQMAEVGASDLHMSVSMPPMIRKDGKMAELDCSEQVLSHEAICELLTSIMPARNQEEFSRRSDTDFAYEIAGLARFRANIFADRKGMGGVFRIIPTKILTAEELGLSPAIMNLCDLSKGLVVVTGPTGSGKSTTLCAMVDSINKNREDHIITIEDPIEFTHENQKCLVNQREVHNHTDSFKDALRAALREDPDIVLVGEMRDLETISIAIETAETGHLVFGTLHTTTACSTVDRIIDQFPADRQQQIRVMLSESLKGVIAQTLVPKKGGGRVAALEVLIVTPAISNLIREGKTFQIPSAMQTGKANGMVMLNDALFGLVQKGIVEPRDAYIKAVEKTGFEAMCDRNGFKI